MLLRLVFFPLIISLLALCSPSLALAQVPGSPTAATEKPGGPTAADETPGGPTSADETPGGPDTGLQNPLNKINSLDELVKAILDAVVTIGGIVLVLALVYVGFLFVAAQGREEEIRNARSALLWTVIGGLILLGAKSIQLVITATVQGL